MKQQPTKRAVLLLIVSTLFTACLDDSPNRQGSPPSSSGPDSPGEAGSDDDQDQTGFEPIPRPENQTCFPPSLAVDERRIRLEEVFSNIPVINPVALLQAPSGSDDFYAVEQGGLVKRFANQPDSFETTLFADLRGKVLGPEFSFETGLLGMAFHPDYENNHRVYFYYTSPVDGENYYACPQWILCEVTVHLSQFTVVDGVVDPDSEVILLSIQKASTIHHAGTLGFGPDGYLYVSVGHDVAYENSQDLNSFLGKFLRIDVNTTIGNKPYAVPLDNPLVGGQGKEEIYAWGFRNPWKWSFDSETGELWAGDVGGRDIEEIDIVGPGENYGWPHAVGPHCWTPESGVFHDNADCPYAISHLKWPVHSYWHSYETDTIWGFGCNSVTGGYVYRGTSLPDLTGVYLYGDFCTGNIWGLFPQDDGQYADFLLQTSSLIISSFGQDREGELYVLDWLTGGIFKMTGYEARALMPNLPLKLSETGCFKTEDLRLPTKGLVPYEINVPLWSDGATKKRWMVLPPEATVSVEDNGDWNFPEQSMFIKQFYLEGELIETRFLVNWPGLGWGGYTYKWDTEKKDGFLVPEYGHQEIISGITWSWPARAQCFRCHTKAAGFSLGPETVQMDRDISYPDPINQSGNQIDLLERMGFFENQVFREEHPPLPQWGDEIASVKDRARAYLHTNCSSCHRPGAPDRGEEDFRYDIPESEMNICNKVPQVPHFKPSSCASQSPDCAQGTSENARLFVPGSPEESVIWLRMIATGEHSRMPPLATQIVDEEAVRVIEEWIRSTSSCPD